MGIKFPHKAKVISITSINHDVILLQITKPFKFEFKIGQAVDLSIDKIGYELAVAPFTIANVPTEDHLKFIIKICATKNGLTQGIAQLKSNDIVQLSPAWDSYSYQGSGTFIAAGTGITPFLPIFKSMSENGIDLEQEHRLIYANKTKDDVLYYRKLKELFNAKLSLLLSRTKSKDLHFGKIDRDYLIDLLESTDHYFYICGPKQFEKDIKYHLVSIGVMPNLIQTGYKF